MQKSGSRVNIKMHLFRQSISEEIPGAPSLCHQKPIPTSARGEKNNTKIGSNDCQFKGYAGEAVVT